MPTSPDRASSPHADPPLAHCPDPLHELEEVLGERFPRLLFQSSEAFRRDLPHLLRQHYRQWVAYSGDQQVALGPSKNTAVPGCLRRGFQRDEFIVESIEPEVPREVEVSPEA